MMMFDKRFAAHSNEFNRFRKERADNWAYVCGNWSLLPTGLLPSHHPRKYIGMTAKLLSLTSCVYSSFESHLTEPSDAGNSISFGNRTILGALLFRLERAFPTSWQQSTNRDRQKRRHLLLPCGDHLRAMLAVHSHMVVGSDSFRRTDTDWRPVADM